MSGVYEQILSLLYTMWRKRWYGLITAWSVCLLGWGIVAAIPNEYESSARLLVEVNSPLLDIVPEASTSTSDSLRKVDIVKRTLTNRPNMEKVIRRTDLDLDLPAEGDNAKEMEKLIEKLISNITLSNQGDDLFTLSYRSADSKRTDEENAKLAQRVVSNLINVFIEDAKRGDRESINQTRSVLEQQIAEYQRRLEESEQKKADFERQNLGYLPGPGNFSQRLITGRVERDQIIQRLAELTASRASLAAQLASIPRTVAAAPSILVQGGQNSPVAIDPNSATARISALERSVNEAFARGFTDQHPDAQIAQLRSAAEEEQRAARAASRSGSADNNGFTQQNPLFVQTQLQLIQRDSDIASARGRLAQLGNEMSELETKVANAPTIEAQRTQLTRDYDAVRTQYETLVQRREKANVAISFQSGTDNIQLEIKDPPLVPQIPIAPNRPLLLTTVALLALASGLGISFILSQLQPNFVTINQLRALTNLPVLGSISVVLSEQQRNQTRLHFGVFLIGTISLAVIYAGLLTLELAQIGSAF
jgi:polysaccharide biosynthesis transport protein